MARSLLDELRDRISACIAGAATLGEFHDWLIPETWDIDDEPENVKRLAHRAQLLLAEFATGHRSEEELLSAFWRLVDGASITVAIGRPLPSPESTTRTERVGIVRELRSVGTLRAGAPA
jgi:hypothetical protein